MTRLEPLVRLVSDAAQMRRFVHASLGSNGYQLLDAARAADAETLATDHKLDLVRPNLGLPEGAGLNVTRPLRTGKGAHPPSASQGRLGGGAHAAGSSWPSLSLLPLQEDQRSSDGCESPSALLLGPAFNQVPAAAKSEAVGPRRCARAGRPILVASLLLFALCAGCETFNVDQEDLERLRSEVETRCANTPPGPLWSTADGIQVEPLVRTLNLGRVCVDRVKGAELYWPVLPHRTKEELERALACQVARAAQKSQIDPDDPLSPLEGPIRTEVQRTDGGYVVLIEALGSRSGNRILERAGRLARPVRKASRPDLPSPLPLASEASRE